ncbi:MAG TPA: lipoate--protein ligase family protein [Anaerolineae bacterium]|nr:lipoate--protein ligase family protein [Anaerolineae bacterium]
MYTRSEWRLIVHGEAGGATNMAIDEAILGAVAGGRSLPTLRLYAWAPPCLSLGRNQPLSDIDLEACRAAGADVVRRPTGGRAILHTDELTYSVALPASDPRAAADVMEGYRRLSEGLLAGLRRLGVDAGPAGQGCRRQGETGPACFEVPSTHEITAGGRKVAGSAQWRGRGGVLQHGSLPVRGDLGRIADLLALPQAERETLRQAVRSRGITLEEALGRAVPLAEAAAALAAGFAEALTLTLVQGDLTRAELARAAELRAGRYASLGSAHTS